jgi:urease accessory protein
MLHLINTAVVLPDYSLPEIVVQVERLRLAKRIWRGTADDGTEFGCELTAPLRDGDTIWQTSRARYVVRQPAEPVIEISLEVAPSAAAGIGWAIGNLHLELSAEASRLLAPDEPAVRQLLDRLKVPFKPTTAIFRPGRFARGNLAANELGSSHKH